MKNSKLWRLEILIPTLIVVGFTCDVVGRFVRVEPLAFRAEEALIQFRSHWLPGPFEPSRQYHNQQAKGDLSNLSNQLEFAIFKDQTFTTDDLGFRNTVTRPAEPPQILIFGSSYTAGSSNSDSETLPAQLESLSGCRIHNAGYSSATVKTVLSLAKQRGMKGGLVVVECVERHISTPIQWDATSRGVQLPYRDRLLPVYRTIVERLTISPLKILFQQCYKSLQNDRVLPNIYKEEAIVRYLSNDQPMLFPSSLEASQQFDGFDKNAESYAKMRDELFAAGFDFAMFIVPEKLTVYGPLLRDPLQGVSDRVAVLEKVEQSLRAKKIDVVNLTPMLIDEAKRSLEDSQLIYWADDTHWNAKGIEFAAKMMCHAFDLRARCGSGTASKAP